MESAQLQERQIFLESVKGALDAYYADLLESTARFLEACSRDLGRKTSITLGSYMESFEPPLSLFNSLETQLTTAARLSNQNSLKPKDAEALRKILTPTNLVVRAQDHSPPAGFFGGIVGGAAAGAALGSVVPGLGTIVGGIYGAMFGIVGGGKWDEQRARTLMIGEVRKKVDSYVADVKATRAKALAFIVDKCVRT